MNRLRYADVAEGRPYHAALVPISESARMLPHSHDDFHELVYVVRGWGWQQVAGVRQELSEGDLVLVRPQDAHDFTTRRDEEFQFINIAFPSERWRMFADFAGMATATAWDLAPDPVLARSTPRGVGRAMLDTLAAYQDGASALDIIGLWTVVMPVLHEAAGGTDIRPGWLVRACTAMRSEENLREGLPRLLQLASVSHGHLARSMSEHFGCRPVEFVNRIRLSHAAMLLATTAEPIGRVAERSGFSSQSYFDRLFLARYGQIPRAYREHARRAVVPNERRARLTRGDASPADWRRASGDPGRRTAQIT
jgi:AraC family transcriptional regulator, dual regulator of chb operon